MAAVGGSASIKINQVEYNKWKSALSVCNDTVRLIVLTEMRTTSPFLWLHRRTE